ncbi:retinol dehydrogenase 7-like [Dermacentor andersoni]|uniref:retinol dehydrogenase 7-like n=1 Tax=Dermacentor andersoni TaxID=34620 RepID=UPI00215552AF|nr:retinol dehydrogenase 7-like [Dermacentor andersoni]
MKVSWVLFIALTAVLWYLWPQLPLLPGIAHSLGSLMVMMCASYFLAKYLWAIAGGRLVSGYGKAVLITGCDTGFGHLLAKFLARDGFLVFAGCLDANGEGATSLKKLANVKVLQMDVTKDAEIDGAHRAVREELGTRKLWAVVCNAAIMNSGLIEWLTMASITRIFDVNVFGVVRVVKKFLPMLKENKGRAVIVTSNLSHFTLPFTTPYAMTKHAVLSLVDGLRRETYGKGVDIVAVEPLTYRSKVTEAVGSLDAVEKEFKSQPAEVMAGYNAQELHDWTRSMKALYEWRIKDDIEELVDQMVLAVREKHPKTRYRTMAIFDYAWVTCLRTLPAEVVDLILLWSRRMALWKK